MTSFTHFAGRSDAKKVEVGMKSVANVPLSPLDLGSQRGSKNRFAVGRQLVSGAGCGSTRSQHRRQTDPTFSLNFQEENFREVIPEPESLPLRDR